MVETKLQPLPRERAPARGGRRTTLRVPDELRQAAEALAEEAGTTTNDALLQLAYQGARFDAQRREVAALARRRREGLRTAWAREAEEAGEDGIVDEEALARAILGDRVDR
jgi:hypothetical protein